MEKFKPIAYRDLEKDDKALFNTIVGHWTDHPILSDYHGYWREYLAWFEGNQYTAYNESTKTLEDLTAWVERETKSVINRTLPMIRQMWGEMRYDHRFFTEQNTDESEDIKAAKLGSVVLDYLLDKGKFNSKANLAKLWALLCQGYMKVFWNTNLFGLIKSKEGSAAKESGEVDFDVVIPFNVRPDFAASQAGKWRWFIEGNRLPTSSIEQEFDLEENSIEAESFINTSETADLVFIRKTTSDDKEKKATRIEYWEGASKKYPKGRFVVLASNYMLYKGDNPSPDQDIPYFTIPGVLPILGTQYYDSMVRLMQSSQRQLNRQASFIDEHIENFKLKAMIPNGSLVGEDKKAFTRAGIDFVEFHPFGAGTPYWQAPPSIPQFYFDWLTFHEKEIETEASIREVSMGRLPKYSSRASGILWQGLKGQDEKVLIPTVEDQDAVFQQMANLILRLVIKHYSIERIVKVVGRDKRTTIHYIKGADLRDNTDVRIRSGVDLFSNKELKQNVVQTLLEKGLIKDPNEAFELLDIKGLEDYIAEKFIDQRQADRENEMIREGKDVHAHPLDNHRIHLASHSNIHKTEDYETWPRKNKERATAHIQEHEALLAAPTQLDAKKAEAEKSIQAGGVQPPGAAPAPSPIEAGQPVPQSPEEVNPELLALLASGLQGGGGMPQGGV